MKMKQIELILKSMYDVSDVRTNYNFWFNKLLNFCLGIMEYDDLPATLPQREIESNLMLTNHACIIPKNGKLYCPETNIYDFDEYFQPTKCVFANPRLGSGTYTLHENAAIIYNSSLQDNIFGIKTDGGLYTLIARYAALLADVDATFDIYSVNARSTFLPVAKSDSVSASLKKFFNLLKLGKREIISDDYILDNVKTLDISGHSTSDNAMSWLQARDKILEQFYRDIGVKFSNQKKENLTEEEVNSNDQLLLISWDDMLKCRQEGIKEVNAMFGLNIKVRINPKYEVKGVNNNDNAGINSKSPDEAGREFNS